MRKVYFADDEPLIVQGLKAILDWGKYGLEVAGTARNGEEALTELLEQPVDLLITDIMMPRLNGLELIRRVKERHPGTKCIVLSGYEEFEYVKTGITLGIHNYILKPINLEELESTVSHIVQEWEREGERRFQLEEDWKVLQSHVLQRWVHGSIDLAELRQRAELLALPLEGSCYQVQVIRTWVEEGEACPISRLADELQAMLLERADEGRQAIAFSDHEDLVVIHIWQQCRHEESRCQSLLPELHVLQQQHGLRLWCTLGRRVCREGLSEVAASYEEGKRQLEQALLAAEAPSQCTGLQELPPAPEGGLELFKKVIIEGDLEVIQDHIREALRVEAGVSLVSRESYWNAAVQLMLAVKELEKNPDYSEVFIPLQDIHTLKQLQEHVRCIVESTLLKQQEQEEGYSPHVSFLTAQVQHHYGEELSLKTLSHRMGLHPNYLGHLFQQEVGVTFSDYLNQFRIEKATQLLLYTDQKTSDIALRVGYLDSSYFYRQFKKYTGVSPTEMRTRFARV
ncbi:two component transcriptional regulator, AraC family [Paenibacillus algicola]|uniref:Two component transcriptional regulator, AraC family n=1 Tax=Paenibacillus algicola TaxID=2565926 RepID=A0A4P8XLP0_9BACL|nr:response regulator transcription factor [Paenibacillus algicola]QCT03697.1 two component transcriptional regulator, AraC family [Paenibacillus algicola]